jgi:hypothetical protein
MTSAMTISCDQYSRVRRPLESSKTPVGRLTGESGCISRVSSARPTTWPPKPTVRNGQYSCHQPETRLLRNVHERLSWKFDRLATRKAIVE